MALVDVSHIQRTCGKDSFVALVDSTNRDKTAYPSPSEYAIDFNEPIRLVYGLSILDAMIPNTMYMVDEHNHRFCVSFIKTPDTTTSELQTTLDTLTASDTCNACLTRALSSPGPVSFNALFCALPSSSAAIEAAATRASEFGPVLPSLAADRTLLFYAKQAPINSAAARAARETGLLLSADAAAGLVTYVQQSFTDEVLPDAVWDTPGVVMLETHCLILPSGNYFFSSLSSSTASLSLPSMLASSVNGPSGQDLIITGDEGGRKYTLATSAPMIIHLTPSTFSPVLGLDSVGAGSGTFDVLKVGRSIQSVITKYDATRDRQVIVPPGIVNLSGIAYIVLRCREIEDSIFRSNQFGKQGLGVFKLAGGVNDVTHLRFDFATFLRKPFHPISKLSRLTFRFERPDGQLYDFKGVNHMFVLSINFFAPESKTGFDAFTLNPSYTPDYMEYAVRQMMLEEQRRTGGEAQKKQVAPLEFAAQVRALAAAHSDDDEEDDGAQSASDDDFFQ